MTHVFRELNVVLGVIALCLLCYRTPQAAPRVTSKRLYFSLAAFPILVCFGSVWALEHHYPPGPMAPFFTVAYVVLASFLIWLPKQLNGHQP